MKVLVLGTSNSLIRDGWTHGLRDYLPGVEITNRSVGASPGIQFSMELALPFEEYACVIFDSVPNDEEFLFSPRLSGVFGPPEIRFTNSVLFEILSTIASKTRLVVLGVCHKNCFQDVSDTYLYRRKLAAAVGAQFIDVRGILLRLQEVRQLSVDQIYESHPAHPKRELMRRIGYYLGRAIGSAREMFFPYEPTSRVTDRSSNFRSVFAADLNSTREVYSLSTSHVTASMARFEPGDEIALDFPGVCLGICINNARTSCTLEVAGYSLRAFFPHNEGKLQKLFIPLPNGIEISSLKVGREREEYSMASLLSVPTPIAGHSAELSLIGVSFWTGQVSAEWENGITDDGQCLTWSAVIERFFIAEFDRNAGHHLFNVGDKVKFSEDSLPSAREAIKGRDVPPIDFGAVYTVSKIHPSATQTGHPQILEFADMPLLSSTAAWIWGGGYFDIAPVEALSGLAGDDLSQLIRIVRKRPAAGKGNGDDILA